MYSQLLKKHIFSLFLLSFLLLLAFTFRSLIFNLQTNLPDWLDYALINWIIYQNVDKIISLHFLNFFDTYAFYPHPYSLLFSDTLIPQSLLFLPIYLLTHQMILSFNITFFLTLILDYISVYLLWKIVFKNDLLSFLGALFFVFSPFFHLESSHFQMLSYWPFFFSLYFLFEYFQSKFKRNLILSGLYLAIQFLASVYLAVFLISTIILFLLAHLIFEGNLGEIIKPFTLIFFIFLLIDGIVIEK